MSTLKIYKCPEIITGANFHFAPVELCILNSDYALCILLRKVTQLLEKIIYNMIMTLCKFVQARLPIYVLLLSGNNCLLYSSIGISFWINHKIKWKQNSWQTYWHCIKLEGKLMLLTLRKFKLHKFILRKIKVCTLDT